MIMGRIKLLVRGNHACFTRLEMKMERVSYDTITPSAARGILEAIYWKPEIRWVVERLHVLKPIRFTSMRRNEVKALALGSAKSAMRGNGTLALYVEDHRDQRASMILRDVEYVIEARIDVLSGEGLLTKHYETFKRRAIKGQCFHRPCLGCREFDAQFAWIDGDPPTSALQGERDLGFMLHDIDYTHDRTPRFFRPTMRDGVIDVPPFGGAEVRA